MLSKSDFINEFCKKQNISEIEFHEKFEAKLAGWTVLDKPHRKICEDNWLLERKAIREFTEQFYELMEEKGISKAEMANLIGKKPAYVTQILTGKASYSISTMVRLARALDCHIHVRVIPKT